jgi:hypothetical protein
MMNHSELTIKMPNRAIPDRTILDRAAGFEVAKFSDCHESF